MFEPSGFFQSWVAILISAVVIVAAAVLALSCLCCEDKKSQQKKHYYVIDENGLQKTQKSSLTNLTFFRQFSNLKLSASALPTIRTDDSDLADSLNICKRLDRTVLRLEINPLECDDPTDEMMSCKSNDSKYTFYSTYTGQPRYKDATDNDVAVGLISNIQ